MKILCLIPPYIPSYFNAGHHLPVFQVGAFLRKNLPDDQITCVDAAALNTTWKEICNLLCEHFDLVALMNDFDAVDTFERFLLYKKKFSPETKVITFGRLSKQIPKFFLRFPIDAVHYHGDFEVGLLNYVRYLKDIPHDLSGILTGKDDIVSEGKFLPVEEWVLPDVQDIPYDAYSFMYKNDFNKFCGIPERQELVIPVARGCPFNCFYCDVPAMQGIKERRLSIPVVINYIQDAFQKLPFEYVSFYAPTFTLKQNWVIELCKTLLTLPRIYSWKCVTVLKCLNEELIRLMGRSGCVRISLGIETFTKSAALNLPKCKQNTEMFFKKTAKIFRDNNIEMNCFIILGLPDDRPEDIEYTIQVCQEVGARVRQTIYTPYHQMTEKMTPQQIIEFNRQFFVDDLHHPKLEQRYYELFYKNKKDRVTQVMKNIKKAAVG